MTGKRLIVIVKESAKMAANGAAQAWDKAITQAQLEASAETFGGTGFSASGAPPATHFACSTVLTEEGMAIAEGQIAALPSGVSWAIFEGPDPSGRVVSTSLLGAGPGVTIGFEEMLAELGVRPVQVEP